MKEVRNIVLWSMSFYSEPLLVITFSAIIAAVDLQITESVFCSFHTFDSSDRFPQRRKPLGSDDFKRAFIYCLREGMCERCLGAGEKITEPVWVFSGHFLRTDCSSLSDLMR